MFRKYMINSELFQDMLEEESIFWVDDLDLAASMAIKTIKTIKEETMKWSCYPFGGTTTTTRHSWKGCSPKPWPWVKPARP